MKIFLSLTVFLLLATALRAQVISVGSTKTLTIKSGTIFGADSLVLTPSADFTLSSNNIKVTSTPVSGIPENSIDRVYTFGSQVSFTGTVKIYYMPAELNGNIESMLQIYDTTVSGNWLPEAASMVNTVNHYVQYVASAKSFIAVTAAQTSTVLKVSLISFNGSWVNDQVLLDWTVSASSPDTKYEVDYSPDGSQWKFLGEVNGVSSTMPMGFYLKDADQQFSSRFYRLKIIDESGDPLISHVIRMDRLKTNNGLKIAVKSRAAVFYFSGDQPSAVRVFNMNGQQVWLSHSSAPQYDVSDLVPGVYLVQYELDKMFFTRKFLIQ